MIQITENFYNKVATEIRAKYFENENHGTTENKNYWEALKAIEDFNNCNLIYSKLISSLTKSCKDTAENIHNTIEKNIISFGSYKYKYKKTIK